MNQTQSNQQHYLVDKASTKMALGGVSMLFVGIGLIIFLLVGRIILDFYLIEAHKSSVTQLMELVNRIVDQEAPNTAIAIQGVEALDWAIFQTSGMYDAIAQMQTNTKPTLGTSFEDDLIKAFFPFIAQTIQSTHIIGARLAIVLSFLPLIFITYLLAMTDGLVERAIRTAEVKRERASRHVQARLAHWGGVTLLIYLYCLWPEPVEHLHWYVFGWLAFVWLMVRMQWTYFKKYF